jgi:hypothetical protein
MTNAGWHPDPSGNNEHRYFSGSEWTDHVSNQGVVSQDVQHVAPPTSVAPVVSMAAPTGYVLTIGDIGLTPSTVFTPNGNAPLSGSQWIAMDMSRTERKIPTWAIVMAIIFALVCLVGLFFLLVKEEQTTGYVEVSVRKGNLYHRTQVPVSSLMQVQQVRQLVNQAQALANQAG